MTPDRRLVELIDTVQHELPDWTPPALPHGDATALLDRLTVARLLDVLTFTSSWPDGVREQTIGAIWQVILAIENDGDRVAARATAWSAAYAAYAAWSGDAAVSAELAANAAWSVHAAWSAHNAAWSAHNAAWSVAYSAASDCDSALGAAWQREADRITTAIKEQS